MGHDARRLRQIVEQRRRLVEKQRQVVLDAGRRETVADVLVQLRLRRIALEALAEILRKRVIPVSSSGNSRAGSSRTSFTG